MGYSYSADCFNTFANSKLYLHSQCAKWLDVCADFFYSPESIAGANVFID